MIFKIAFLIVFAGLISVSVSGIIFLTLLGLMTRKKLSFFKIPL